MSWSSSIPLCLLAVLVAGTAIGGVVGEPSPTTQQVEDELLQRLRALERRPHGMTETDRAGLAAWVQEHAPHVVSKARAQLLSTVRDPKAHATDVHHSSWMGAARMVDAKAAESLFVELVRELNYSLQFADPLWKKQSPVTPAQALGLEKYQQALGYMHMRNLLLQHLTEMDSDALVEEAKELVEGEMSTVVHAVRYLRSQMRHHPTIREFLIDRSRDKASHLHRSALLNGL